MASFFDVSNWSEKHFLNTGGTRNKSIVEKPDTSDLYYFKTSLKRVAGDYKHEFWSEIIASEIGRALGFNTLKYDIAYKDGEIGCLSKAMNKDSEELREGMGFLKRYDNSYNPDDKASYNKYTFDFIHNALKHNKIDRFISDIIKIIIFDSIIGNQDRHQENWGLLVPIIRIPISQVAKGKILYNFMIYLLRKYFKIPDFKVMIRDYKNATFSPIYDSGSCLGREIEDKKLNDILRDNQRFEAYINKGCSEIRWDGPKINHFKLIDELKTPYKDLVKEEITKTISNAKQQNLKEIVFDIDKELRTDLGEHKLPEERKDFIFKLITLRLQKLEEMI